MSSLYLCTEVPREVSPSDQLSGLQRVNDPQLTFKYQVMHHGNMLRNTTARALFEHPQKKKAHASTSLIHRQTGGRVYCAKPIGQMVPHSRPSQTPGFRHLHDATLSLSFPHILLCIDALSPWCLTACSFNCTISRDIKWVSPWFYI